MTVAGQQAGHPGPDGVLPLLKARTPQARAKILAAAIARLADQDKLR
jgi:hypothetical protein